jgi:hypothetical protein
VDSRLLSPSCRHLRSLTSHFQPPAHSTPRLPYVLAPVTQDALQVLGVAARRGRRKGRDVSAMLQIVRTAQLLTMHSSALNQTNSPLLRLPAELRNRVYEYVFGDVRLILGNCPGARIMTNTGHDVSALALATTSRQLYVETKLLPFVLGHLLAYSVGYLMSGIKKLGPEQRQAIRNIESDYYDSDFSIFNRNSGEIFSSTLPAPSLQDLVRPILVTV